jgi:hypothetical protein
MIFLKTLPGGGQELSVTVMKLTMIILMGALMCAACSVAEIPSQNRETQAENRQLYSIYQQYMRSQNQERAMSGVPPKPIRPYEEWQKSPGMD